MRSSAEYTADLMKMKPNIFIGGEKVARDDPRVKPGINVLAVTFDLAEDPGERKNLARARREQTEFLLTLLQSWNRRWPAFETQTTIGNLRPEDVEALRKLGYLDAPSTGEP